MGTSSDATASRSVRLADQLGRESAEALAGILDIASPVEGEPVPPLWHWVYFLNRCPQSDLGPDGHPVNGIPSPPEPGLLRMFAGGRVWTNASLVFGVQAESTTQITSSVEKNGTSGPLRFVTVRSTITQGQQIAVIEERDIVYRSPGPRQEANSGAGGVEQGTPLSADTLSLATDPVLLFRFSALTYNAHRIHYDAGYASEEGYPDLVVHGPLQALLMGEHLRRSGKSFVGRLFSYRLLAPTFSGERLTASSQREHGQMTVRVQDSRQTTAIGALTETPRHPRAI